MSNVVYIYMQDDSLIFTPDEIANIKAILQSGKTIGNLSTPTFTIYDTNGVSYTMNNNVQPTPPPSPDPTNGNSPPTTPPPSPEPTDDSTSYFIPIVTTVGIAGAYFLYKKYRQR